MKIAVIGTGYVGLVTGTCLAESGNQVTCVDIDKAKVAHMKAGKVPIYEPDLDTLFIRNINDKRLSFTSDIKEGIREADIIFLALPTPPDGEGAADLRYVLGVADELGSLLDHDAVIVNKSTVPVGTGERVQDHIAKNAKCKFAVVSNPEFLREGFAVGDFMKPDRIVVGCDSKWAEKRMRELYEPFVQQGSLMLVMDIRSAEMTKYAANSFLATKISFMNEIANLCELVGADVDSVRTGIGSDERIGRRFLFPGIGYGGSCFPKDVRALQHTSQEQGYDMQILSAVMNVNSAQAARFVSKIKTYFKDNLESKKIALWGLAFKPDTDDIREAPALIIIQCLLEAGATVRVFDPEAMPNVKKLLGDQPGVDYADDQYDCLTDADALVIATEWPLFSNPDFERLKAALHHPVIFDGRNMYNTKTMSDNGFHYESIGRGLADKNR